jgi:hypothetical protein
MHANDLAIMTGIYGALPEQFRIAATQPRTLKDTELSGITFWCMDKSRGSTAVDKQDTPFGERVPPHAAEARKQYERLREHPFFDRFVLFARTESEDGMIVAIGRDEFYYVLATWDRSSERVWVPEFEQNDRGRTKLTEACLGH